MISKYFNDSRFKDWALIVDQEKATEIRKRGCIFCKNGSLHSSNYTRKPRGGPHSLDSKTATRLSFCCDQEGCRKRHKVPSVQFFGARVYTASVFILVCAMVHGVSKTRLRHIRQEFGVDRRTLGRWRTWWKEIFPVSVFWKVNRGRFVAIHDEHKYPMSLLNMFSSFIRKASEGGDNDDECLKRLLIFLSAFSMKYSADIHAY